MQGSHFFVGEAAVSARVQVLRWQVADEESVRRGARHEYEPLRWPSCQRDDLDGDRLGRAIEAPTDRVRERLSELRRMGAVSELEDRACGARLAGDAGLQTPTL